MAATLQNLIEKGCVIAYEGTASSSFKSKLKIIAAHFSTLRGFKRVHLEDIMNLRSVEGDRTIKSLSTKEKAAITSFQREIEVNKSIVQNFIKILTKSFISKQITMLSSITIESFNANPILCAALNLKTPEEFVRYNAYQAIGRSIVTSMGFMVEDLLLYSNEYVFKGNNYVEGDKTKFDFKIDRHWQVICFLQIKSGFNDMDAGLVR